MKETIEFIISNETLLWWLAASSVFTFLITLSAVPFFIIRIPSDYFLHDKRRSTTWADQHSVVQMVLLICKNMLGIIFIIIGLLLLFLPGQGILTILIGILLLNFPGKYRLEQWLVKRPPVLQSINWLRRRASKNSIIIDLKTM